MQISFSPKNHFKTVLKILFTPFLIKKRTTNDSRMKWMSSKWEAKFFHRQTYQGSLHKTKSRETDDGIPQKIPDWRVERKTHATKK